MRTGPVVLPASTRETPEVRSTTSRSPRTTFWPWLTTTLPVSVTELLRISNNPVSPVAVWSFCVTITPPRASSLLICCEPPGPGVAALAAPGVALSS